MSESVSEYVGERVAGWLGEWMVVSTLSGWISKWVWVPPCTGPTTAHVPTRVWGIPPSKGRLSVSGWVRERVSGWVSECVSD